MGGVDKSVGSFGTDRRFLHHERGYCLGFRSVPAEPMVGSAQAPRQKPSFSLGFGSVPLEPMVGSDTNLVQKTIFTLGLASVRVLTP